MRGQSARTREIAPEPRRADDLAAARRVVLAEARALDALAASLNEALIDAIDVLGDERRRVVVTGMGKSGHVGAKIAATLASTGTPAQFVHPAEASHGDLGMITRGDAVLALSNSGETAELRDVIRYCARFSVPLVAICSRRRSTLGRAADVVLELPALDEACPLGLAPTTSTTMALALGDAIAVALLERRGFSPSDFSAFHPGGKLGAQLSSVRDLMRTGDDLPLVRARTPMKEAVVVMSAKRLGCLAITEEDGRLIGVVTDGDLRRRMSDDLFSREAGELMTHDPKTIAAEALAAEALAAMNAASVTVLFVVDPAGRPIGALHVHDCLQAGVA